MTTLRLPPLPAIPAPRSFEIDWTALDRDPTVAPVESHPAALDQPSAFLASVTPPAGGCVNWSADPSNAPAWWSAPLPESYPVSHLPPTEDAPGTTGIVCDEEGTPLGYTAPLPMPVVSGGWSDVRVNEKSIALIEAEQAVLATVGLATDRKDLFFDAGTAFMAIGHENALKERARVDALPDMLTGIASLKATIAAEERRDTTADLANFRINANGDLQAWNGTEFTGRPTRLGATAWRQLVGIAGEGQNVNRGLATSAPGTWLVRARNVG